MEASCEKAAAPSENTESVMRLSWALVHSRNASDVQRGIAMLEGVSLACVNTGFVFNNIAPVEMYCYSSIFPRLRR